ncbi:crystal protein [Patella vulgata]|uniref:crystal protein n=1 Tax=Patella vulgata TaxID=6465 RepID=UPI0024A99F6F|nr:crystal protein [Patella vulgata]
MRGKRLVSEDCLYLDIFTPLNTNATSGLAVMVYIHGGNFVHMSANSLLFDAQVITMKGNIVHVNVEYRLGVFGFLVTGPGDQEAHGNYGIRDQQLALKWVQENIRGFGGDPAKVTLYGQSAGAQSTMIHLSNPESAPYFQQAIVESSPFTIPYKSYTEALILSSQFSNLAGCTPLDIECLRRKTSEELVFAQFQSRSKIASLKLLEAFEPWGPVVDGILVDKQPLVNLANGEFSKKPIMLGTTSEETRIYIYSAWGSRVDNLKYFEVVIGTYPRQSLKILYEYPPDQPTDERDDLSKLSTDLVFVCSTRNATRSLIKHGNANTWLYIWDHAFSFPGWGNITFCEGHVCHGSEIPYVFQTASLAGFKYTPDEIVLSDLIIQYWTNFAKTGDPNKGMDDDKYYVQNAPVWPVYTKTAKYPILHFQTPASSVENDYQQRLCDFWDTIGYSA